MQKQIESLPKYAIAKLRNHSSFNNQAPEIDRCLIHFQVDIEHCFLLLRDQYIMDATH